MPHPRTEKISEEFSDEKNDTLIQSPAHELSRNHEFGQPLKLQDGNEISADTASADGLLLRQQPQTLIA